MNGRQEWERVRRGERGLEKSMKLLNLKTLFLNKGIREVIPIVLIIPSIIFLTVFIVGSLISLLFYVGNISYTFVEIVFRADFQTAYLRTLRVALIVALITTTLAYPVAFYVLHMSYKMRQIMKALIWLPVMINPIVRGYGWMIILGRLGLVNTILLVLGIINEPIKLLYTELAMIFGLTELFFPFMFISLLSAMENISDETIMAAYSLGANTFRVFKDIVMPLSIKGYVFGVTIVVTGCSTAFTTPTLLGGPQNATLSMLLAEYVSILLDWRKACAIALIILATVLAISELASVIVKKR